MKIPELVKRVCIPVLAHVALIGVWQLWIVLGDIQPFIMPSPWATLEAMLGNYGWAHNTWVTAQEIFGGYIVAVLFGVSAALAFSWFRALDAAAMPLIVTINMIPKVALGPIFIVWFSYGVGTNILMSFAICFLPILITTERGLREVEPDLIDLVRALRATRWQIFVKIQLPGSLPYIFSGMKVAVVLAVAGAIVGEFIASEEGLGYVMQQVQANLDTAAMFAAVFLITFVGVALYGVVLGLERLTVPRDARID